MKDPRRIQPVGAVHDRPVPPGDEDGRPRACEGSEAVDVPGAMSEPCQCQGDREDRRPPA